MFAQTLKVSCDIINFKEGKKKWRNLLNPRMKPIFALSSASTWLRMPSQSKVCASFHWSFGSMQEVLELKQAVTQHVTLTRMNIRRRSLFGDRGIDRLCHICRCATALMYTASILVMLNAFVSMDTRAQKYQFCSHLQEVHIIRATCNSDNREKYRRGAAGCCGSSATTRFQFSQMPLYLTSAPYAQDA